MINASVGFNVIIFTFTMQFISVRTSTMVFMSLASSALCLILACLMLPESPKYLYATSQYERCKAALTKISASNGNRFDFT